MGLRNGGNHRVAQQLRRVSPAAEGIPALGDDPQALDVGHNFRLLVVGVDLVLHQGGGDVHLGQKLFQLLDVPVGQADGADLPVCHRLLHGMVRLHISVAGVVQEHQVDVADVQLFHGLVNGSLGITELAGIELGDNENFFSRHTGIPDRPAHSLLVVVHIGGVDEPPARLQQGGDGVVALLVGEAVGSKAHNGHFIPTVQQDSAGLKVEDRRSALLGLRQSQALDPLLNLRPAGSAGKAGALLPVCIGGEAVQVVVAGADAAGMGGAEGYDGLAGEIIGLQEGGNDLGRLAVPDGVAQQNDLIPRHILYAPVNGGAGVRVVPLHLGAAVRVCVVQVLVGIRVLRDDLIEVGVQNIRRILRQRPGGPGGGEVGHQNGTVAIRRGLAALQIAGQQGGCLRPRQRCLRLEGTVRPAGEQSHCLRPTGGGDGPISKTGAVGESPGRGCGRTSVAPQDGHRLLPGHRVIRAEGVVPVAVHDALHPGPVDPVRVPAVPRHIGEGVAQVFLLQGGTPRHSVEGGGQHGAAQRRVRRKGCIAGPGEDPIRIAVLHLIRIPGVCRNVREGQFLGYGRDRRGIRVLLRPLLRRAGGHGQGEGCADSQQEREHSFLHLRFSFRTGRITRAGTPPTTMSGGTSFVTTAPAATMAPSPMVTPGVTVALAPIHTFFPMTMGAA